MQNKNNDKREEWVCLSTIIEQPNNEDVLFGRGNSIKAHPGNVYFRSLVMQAKPIWDETPKFEKPTIAAQIIDSITNTDVPGGRFLKHDSATGLWRTATYAEAMDKTKKALREKKRPQQKTTMKKKKKKCNQEQNSPCSMRNFEDLYFLQDEDWTENPPLLFDNEELPSLDGLNLNTMTRLPASEEENAIIAVEDNSLLVPSVFGDPEWCEML